MAQSDEDSTSVVNELTLDEPEVVETQVDDLTETDNENFIKKEERQIEWKTSAEKNIPKKIIKSLKEEDAFWYADLEDMSRKKPEEQNQKQKTPLGMQPWFKTILWILILGGFAFFLITYLAGSNVGLFRKKSTIVSEESEAMPEDIFTINYQKEIDKAAAAGNYRLAVRLMFLRLLKNMSEREFIKYKQDKTNFDYLSEVYNSRWYKQFFKVTRNYEYSWYGKFEISEEIYMAVKNDFVQFENQLS